MKSSPKPLSFGVALVLVLGMLALIAVLVIAFLTSVSTELSSAKSFASGADAKQFADSAVNIVTAQIQEATGNPSLAWASQPGMIRTYDDTGAATRAYKLYSSGQLQIDGAFNPVTSLASEIPDNWADAANSSLFTDLNKPVGVGSTLHYPIINPVAVNKDKSYDNNAPATLDPLDPAGSATNPPIEGCFLDTTKPLTAVTTTQTNPVPMPVRWLYVLKDGSIKAMDPTTKKVAGAGKILADGTKNIITGRVAFWADDESCKVNVNTASEGTFWDRPMAYGPTTTTGAAPNLVSASYEWSLQRNSPVQNEFQRYPGHPAMTCLSPILPRFSDETAAQYGERIYGIIPRVVGGGTVGGTKNTTGTSAPVVPDSQHLFASVDEFMFGVTADAAGNRQANPKDASAHPFTPDDLEKTRFFLTANGRSPEVNLFNKPRVSLWPLQANTATVSDPSKATERNAKDKLIAFCSTVGSGSNAKPYYFQRYNTFDQTKFRPAGATVPYDPSSLQNPIPSSQSPSMDWTNIPRNREIFAYLQSLVQKPIPGLGGSLVGGKYSVPVGDQILTEMMDYIRSSINTYRSKPTAAVSNDGPYYTYTPYATSGWVTGQGQIVPLVITPPGATYQTKGFGRFATITQAVLVFYRTDKLQYVPNPATPASVPTDLVDGAVSGKVTVLDLAPGVPFTIPPFAPFTPPAASPLNAPLKTPTMRCVLLLQPINVTPGQPPWNGNYRVRITGLDGLKVKMGSSTTPLGFGSSLVNLVNGKGGANYYANSALNQTEVQTDYWAGQKTLGPTVPGSADEEKFYPFCSVPVPLTAGTFDIVGADIKIEIYSGCSNPNGINAGDLVQTINMSIPSSTTGGAGLPIPTIRYTNSYSAATGQTTLAGDNEFADYNYRLAEEGYNTGASSHPHRHFIVGDTGGDTVRSVQARYGFAGGGGDYRLISGLTNVPSVFFEGHGLVDPSTDGLTYNTTTTAARLLHSLRAYVATGSNDDKSNGFYGNNNNATGLTNAKSAATGGWHGRLVADAVYLDPMNSGGSRPSLAPVAAQGMKGAYMDAAKAKLGDWDNGPGNQIDGPYINKADEGNSNLGWYASGSYQTAQTMLETGSSFSPNRQVSSAVTFGSLPSGIDPSDPAKSVPWRTLLFCKNPAAGGLHPGFGVPSSGPPYTTPPDHAFLDLFTMPIVEPYAISEPFSTAGKVNMNYQMVPFTYLTRSTGVRAVLKSTDIMAIPTTSGTNYKANAYDGNFAPALDFRYTINRDETLGTLAGFEQRFGTGDIFRSASEICDIYLVPNDPVGTAQSPGSATKYSTMGTWWNDYKLTGDNVREGPYGHIYPRLTTKSNTYTVHVLAQALKKSVSSPVDQYVDGKDQVSGEFRGSFIIERYLDPNSDSLVKADGKTPAAETDADAMVGPYKFRVVSSKRFAP